VLGSFANNYVKYGFFPAGYDPNYLLKNVF